MKSALVVPSDLLALGLAAALGLAPALAAQSAGDDARPASADRTQPAATDRPQPANTDRPSAGAVSVPGIGDVPAGKTLTIVFRASVDAGPFAAGKNDLANQGTKMFMDRLRSGQGVGSFMKENASNALNGVGDIKGIDFNTMGGDEIVNVLRLLSGASTLGMGPMGQYASNNALDDLQYQADVQGLTDPMGDPTKPQNASVLNTGGGRKNFQDILQRYLALR